MSVSKSSSGFPPYAWGSSMWSSLLFIALNYPVHPTRRDKHTYETFFKLLGDVLPCAACSENYKEHTDSMVITEHLNSRESLVRWLCHVHNEVNVSKEPPAPKLNRQEIDKVISLYESFRSKSKPNPYRGVVLFTPKRRWKHRSSVVKANDA